MRKLNHKEVTSVTGSGAQGFLSSDCPPLFSGAYVEEVGRRHTEIHTSGLQAGCYLAVLHFVRQDMDD